MSRAPHIAVSREYKPAPDDCVRALESLLKTSARNEGGTVITAPDDAKEIKSVRATDHDTR